MAHNKDLIENPKGGLPRLLEIMRALRDPQHGCPWDIEQDFASIAPYTIGGLLSRSFVAAFGAKHMRMAHHHFIADPIGDILKAEQGGLMGHLRVIDGL